MWTRLDRHVNEEEHAKQYISRVHTRRRLLAIFYPSIFTQPFHLIPSCWPTPRRASTRQIAIVVVPGCRRALRPCGCQLACPPANWSSSERTCGRAASGKLKWTNNRANFWFPCLMCWWSLYGQSERWANMCPPRGGCPRANYSLDCLHHRETHVNT